MLCVQCKNRNPVGNKFCRECGGRLAVSQDVLAAEEAARAEAERTQEHVARLLTDAHSLAEQNKFEQAILLAEEAAELMPSSTSSQSLLARLYEQVGAAAKAVAAMERVVAMNPGSEADLATLDRLKRLAAASPGARLLSPAITPAVSRPTATQSFWLPIVAAGMAGAFVLGVGLSVVNNRNADAVAQKNTLILPNAQVATNGNLPVAPSTSASPGAVASSGMTIAPGAKISLPPPSDATGDPFASRNPVPVTVNNRPAATQAPVNRPAPNISAASSLPLPGPLARNSATTIGPAPVKLIGVPTGGNKPSEANNNQSGFGQGGRIVVGAPSASQESNQIPAAAPTPQPQGDGYISISVRPPHSSNTSANSGARSSSSSSPDSSAGPMLRAQSLQSAGKYPEAIASYQMAVSADPSAAGEAYQGIAMCYQRMNDNGSARAAYRNAIAGYESAAASGRGGNAAQRGIAACKAQLEVLGG
jgi:tetratricopeptide (TPR) repeat protein